MAVSSFPRSREAQLERQLAAVTQERDHWRNYAHSLQSLLRNPEHRGTRAAVADALVLKVHTYRKTHQGHTGPVPIFLDDIAKIARTGAASVSRKIAELHERKLVKAVHRSVRTESGMRQHLLVSIPAIEQGPAVALQTIADYQAPLPPSKTQLPSARNWGGTRLPCPEHGYTTAGMRDPSISCQLCGVVIEYKPLEVVYPAETDDISSIVKVTREEALSPTPVRPHAKSKHRTGSSL
jgi:hypothetical protein